MDQNTKPEITVASICAAIGRQAVADAFKVGLTAVSNACVDNRFPAKWYLAMRALCEEHGLECPHSLFTFVAVTQQERGAA